MPDTLAAIPMTASDHCAEATKLLAEADRVRNERVGQTTDRAGLDLILADTARMVAAAHVHAALAQAKATIAAQETR
jgi:hypothetical protein